MNGAKIPFGFETKLFLNDLIGLGINPATSDESLRTNFIYRVIKAESVEIDDSDSDDNMLEISDPNLKETENVSCETENAEKALSANEDGDDIFYDAEGETNVDQQRRNSAQNPIPSTSKLPNKVASSFRKAEMANIAEKEQKLRHHNLATAKLIEPLPQKKRRKRIINFEPEDDDEAAEPVKKRGRPRKSRDPEINLKLKILADSKTPKEPKRKRKQGLKVKNTVNNRGKFLTEAIPKVPKRRGRPKKNVI